MSGFIHLTKADRVQAILEHGLLTGRDPELTSDAVWTLIWYETNPVFLGHPDAEFMTVWLDSDPSLARIEVDTKGLELVADLASLIDKGARYDEDGYLFWPLKRAPKTMLAYLDWDGAIEINFLLDPEHPACQAAIEITGTAACLSPVGPDRLSLQSVALTP